MTLTWTIARSPDQRILIVTTEGTITAKSADGLVAELGALGLTPGTGILLDHRGSTLSVDSADLFNRPKVYEQYADARRYPVALLFQEVGEPQRFYEMVCQNRGFPMAVFADYEKAMSWLAARMGTGARTGSN